MAKSVSSFESDRISECSLHKDPRVFPNEHAFCEGCSYEQEPIGSGSCSLCRPFKAIPDDGFEGHSMNYFIENLVDLHQSYMDRSSNSTGEKVFDTPLVEQFKLMSPAMHQRGITWLEQKIYVIDIDLNNHSKIRIFNDQAPFEESPDSIQLERAFYVIDMTSSKINRALFVVGYGLIHEYIIKIRMPRRKVTRRRIEGSPQCLSITPNNELLVVMDKYDELDYDFVICLFRLKDLSEKKCILLPSGIESVSCAAQLPNKNFIISYSTKNHPDTFRMAELPNEGKAFTRHFDLNLFDSIKQKLWNPHSFAVMNNGQIIVGDAHGQRLIWLNYRCSGYLIISNKNSVLAYPRQIIYIKDKQQLLMFGTSPNAPFSEAVATLYHISPCSHLTSKRLQESAHREVMGRELL